MFLSRAIQISLILLTFSQGGWNEVRGVCQTPSSLEVWDSVPDGCFQPWISSSYSSILLSSLTKTTFNPSPGPLALPDGGGRVLAAMCDPALINRVGEGKGAMHTPIHYLIRIAHSERWSLSLYLNEGGWTRHSMSHPVRLSPTANAQSPTTCPFTPFHIKSHHFTRWLAAGEKFALTNS